MRDRMIGALLLSHLWAMPAVAEESRFARLEREVGQGTLVAVLPSKEGLLAASLGGERTEVLAPGAVTWAYADPALKVVWLGREVPGRGTLELLDLNVPDPKPEIIAKAMPDGVPVEVLFNGVASTPRCPEAGPCTRITLEDGKAVARALASLTEAAAGGPAEGPGAVTDVAFTPGTDARFVALAKKVKPSKKTPPKSKAKKDKKVLLKVEVPRAPCEDAALCGLAEAVPGTPFWLVIVAHSCDDECHPVRQLYDTRDQKFFDPTKPAERLDNPLPGGQKVSALWIDGRGEGYVSGGIAVRLSDGKATGTGGIGGSFLTPGHFIR